MALWEGFEDVGGVFVEDLGVGEAVEGFEGLDEVLCGVEVVGVFEESYAPAEDGEVLPLLVVSEALLVRCEVGVSGVWGKGWLADEEEAGEGFVVVGGGFVSGEEVGAGAALFGFALGVEDIVDEALFEGEDSEECEDVGVGLGEFSEVIVALAEEVFAGGAIVELCEAVVDPLEDGLALRLESEVVVESLFGVFVFVDGGVGV